MKEAVIKIEFFMNKDNMQHLMKGYIIRNFDQIKELIFDESDTPFVYAARDYKGKMPVFNAQSEYPNASDRVIGKVVGYCEENCRRFLKVALADSLTYSMMSDPCIKVNGYCTVGCEDGQDFIIIDKVTRLTIADRNVGSDLYIPSVD